MRLFRFLPDCGSAVSEPSYRRRGDFSLSLCQEDLPNGLRLITIPTDYPNIVSLYIVVGELAHATKQSRARPALHTCLSTSCSVAQRTRRRDHSDAADGGRLIECLHFERSHRIPHDFSKEDLRARTLDGGRPFPARRITARRLKFDPRCVGRVQQEQCGPLRTSSTKPCTQQVSKSIHTVTRPWISQGRAGDAWKGISIAVSSSRATIVPIHHNHHGGRY